MLQLNTPEKKIQSHKFYCNSRFRL